MLRELRRNPNLLRRVFSELHPLTYFAEFSRDRRQYRCPFHDDTNPSAQLHTNDDDGVEKLWCFACRKQFYSYDYVRMHRPDLDLVQLLEQEASTQELEVAVQAQKRGLRSPLPDWDAAYEELWKGNLCDYVKRAYLKTGGLWPTDVEQFIECYSQLPKIEALKPMDGDEYRWFTTKGSRPVAIFNSGKHLPYLPHVPDCYDYFNGASPSDRPSPTIWLIPCDLPDGEVYGFVMRYFHRKEYRTVREKPDQDTPRPPLLFGFDSFADFEPGQPIILTEGVKDCLALRRTHPFVLALLGDGLSAQGLSFLKPLSKTFLIALDNHPVARVAASKLQRSLRRIGCRAMTVFPIARKDWAECRQESELRIVDSSLKMIA